MAVILPMQFEQAAEARRVIYTTAHGQFHSELTLKEAVARYQTTWPLPDIDDYQKTYVENGGAFLVMVEDGEIIGTGALRRLEDGVAEIKRLWLLPEFQGQGLGYQMITALLELAREKGYDKVRLETSPAYQARAFAFYQRLGFIEIPRYGDDPDDVGMELVLNAPV
jgi:putative acetyltransferase